MAPNPIGFLSHLREAGYNPRSSKHSDALSEVIVDDLLAYCPAFQRKAAAGEVVYDLNFTIFTGTAEWNIDLVIGTPPPGIEPPSEPGSIVRSRPSTVEIGIEHKAVMTEHRKAVKNRKRDFEAHHDHLHRYNSRAIAGGVLLVNGAETFQSPLRSSETKHRNPGALVQHCVDQMRAVSQRSGTIGVGMEAKAVIVLDMDNVDHGATRYSALNAAPKVGDPMHYDAFIQTLCSQYTERFC